MKLSKLVAALLIASIPPAANVASLDSIGPIYLIGEESALDVIMKKLRERERSGRLKRLQEEIIHRSMSNIKNMKPVDGTTTARVRVQRFIDPTVTHARPVTTGDGRIVVPAGAKINPLDMISPTKTLTFFNGRDPEQREAVGRSVAKGGQLKMESIPVVGSWLDPTKTWETQVLHDQKDTLSKRFGIVAVPAVTRQQGKMLVLDEIPAKGLQ